MFYNKGNYGNKLYSQQGEALKDAALSVYLISMLGYEREEFEEIFKDGTSKLNHNDDKVFMHEFTQSGVKGNSSFGLRARWVKKTAIRFGLSSVPAEQKINSEMIYYFYRSITGNVVHTQKADDYIKGSDKMLYESKQNGRNRYTAGKL